MSNFLDVNTDELVQLTNGLERFRRSMFPQAVRRALNSAAFDVKKNTLPATTRRMFTQRRANFFKANSRVFMARGTNVNSMQSEIGMVDIGGNNYAVDNLVQQERGGIIKGKSFIPLDTARVSSSYKRNVRSKARLKNIDKMVQARKTLGSSKSQRFVKAVRHAGVGGVVLDEGGIVWRVQGIKGDRGGGFKLKAIYSYKERRTIKVKGTHFMQTAGERSAKKLPDFYVAEAGKMYRKALKV